MGDLAVEARVDRLEADPPISVESVDLTIVDPARLRLELGHVIRYFAVVEGDVAQNASDIAALLPHLDRDERRFLRAWSTQEVAHGRVFDAIAAQLQLAPPPAVNRTPPPRRVFAVVGRIAKLEWVHDVLKLMYLARGAMHEHLTYDGYVHLGARLARLGELGLARTVTEPVRRQEARHLGYYRMAAAAQRRRLSPNQLHVARAISIRSYAPVGASPGRRAECGRAFASLAGSDVDRILGPVEAIATQLLGNGAGPVPQFVRRAMRRCMEEAGLCHDTAVSLPRGVG
jgi:hypothetical protein